jgi:hypothetical protein
MSTLTYLTTWRAISARIHGLEKAAAVHARFLASHSGSPYGADKALQKHCQDILASVEEFHQSSSAYMPAAALSAINRFMADGGKQIRDNIAGDTLLVRTIIVKLLAFESEMTYCLDSPTEGIRSASELAFMHLQRLIVADGEYREKWQKAFAQHETRCEMLGALHLLWHGIWAFKVDATGGKTDLVYQEPPNVASAPAALGMILTEWKRSDGDVTAAYAAARRQAALYSGGILAGLELATHRYLVAVTEKQIQPPADAIADAVTYRHINIAVNPELPSVAAKRLAK